MVNRRAFFILAVSSAALAGGGACSDSTRYRVVKFFFDGVPEPGAAPAPGYPAPPGADFQQPPEQAGSPTVTARPIRPHPPYRDGRCGSCHDRGTGQLFRTPEEGLCGSCHQDLPGPVRYVHGPVAVKSCLFCHHHHGSPRPRLLLAEVTETCFRCHDRARLAATAYHAAVEGRSCTECHNPHGGDNRFFLTRSEP